MADDTLPTTTMLGHEKPGHRGLAASRQGPTSGLTALDWPARYHALRQPLHAIGLFCAALRGAGVPAHAQGLIDGITASAAAMEAELEELAALLALAPDPQVRPRPASDRTGHAPVDADLQSAHESVAASPAGAPLPNRLPVQALAPAPFEPKRVVIVDDNPAARQSLELLLGAWEVGVLSFGSLDTLQDFLTMTPGTQPDLCIVDYHLGHAGEGLTALDMLRRAWPDQPLRAVLMTGDVRAAQTVRRTLPDLEVLVKPVAPAALLMLIEERVKRSRGCTDTAPPT